MTEFWSNPKSVNVKKSQKLRDSARGQSCLVRIPGVCNYRNETTVLAHIGDAGIANKQPDIFGAFCCSSCHDYLDGRIYADFSTDELKLLHLQGMMRTQMYWWKNGIIGVLK